MLDVKSDMSYIATNNHSKIVSQSFESFHNPIMLINFNKIHLKYNFVRMRGEIMRTFTNTSFANL